MSSSLCKLVVAITLIGAQTLFGQPAIAQPMQQHPQLAQPLAEKWLWGLDQIASNPDAYSWMAYQFTTTLDEKVVPHLISGVRNYLQWNNSSQRGIWSDYNFSMMDGGWSNGISTSALLAGSTDMQQSRDIQHELVVLARFRQGELSDLRVADTTTPINWQHHSVYWLGNASTAESLRLLSSELTTDLNTNLQHALIRLIGYHSNTDRSGYLFSLYNTDQWKPLRSSIVESLALQKSDEIEALLITIATDENAPLIERRIAISALSRYPSSTARNTLMALAAPLHPQDVRLEAIESLALYDAEAVLTLLQSLLNEDAALAIQRQALDSIASFPDQFETLQDVMRNHENPDLRRYAITRLTALDSMAAFPALSWLVLNDPNGKVQQAAVAAMRTAPPALAIPALTTLALAANAQPTVIRKEAIESLARFDTQAVRELLNTVAWSDSEARLRTEAIESLARMDSTAAKALLLEIARNHPSQPTSRVALQQLQKELF